MNKVLIYLSGDMVQNVYAQEDIEVIIIDDYISDFASEEEKEITEKLVNSIEEIIETNNMKQVY